jgi:hypothetical protein
VCSNVFVGLLVLMQTVESVFPHQREDRSAQCTFLANVLHVLTYVPSLCEGVLVLVVQRLLVIDVAIDLNKCPDEDEVGGVFKLDLDQEGDDQDEPPALSKAAQEQKDLSNKLDGLMAIMFDYIERRHTLDTFQALIRAFKAHVLNMYKSKFTQYLVFRICAFENHYIKDFLTLLHEGLFENRAQPNTRCAQNAPASGRCHVVTAHVSAKLCSPKLSQCITRITCAHASYPAACLSGSHALNTSAHSSLARSTCQYK